MLAQPMLARRGISPLLVCCLAVGAWSTSASAQSDVPAEEPQDAAAAQEELHLLEQALLNDYRRFEEKLLELAEYTRRTDPDRAQLLRDARSKSTSMRIAAQMERIAQSLTPNESGEVLYGDAESRQEELLADLAELLKHLQSEDERDRLADEIKRLQELLKETLRLIGREKDVRADTERGRPFEKLQDDQQRVAEAAEKLAEKIDQQDAQRRAADEQRDAERQAAEDRERDPSLQEGEPPHPEQSREGESLDRESQSREESESREGQTKDQESQGPPQPSSGERPPGEPPPGQSPQEPQQPSQGEPPQSAPQQQKQKEQQTPGRQQLEQARQRMQQAIEQLEQEQRDKASDEQDAAIARLEEMKAQLEEILRQLREEEQKLFLTMLEARFKRMLELQLDINNGTLKLDRVSPESRDDDRHLAESTRLGRDEDKNVAEAEKALTLLKEEGSSVAFPEAVEMMRDNMQAVSGRLQRGLTDEKTQLLERLIVEALEEMIFALQREMEKQDQRQQQGEGQQTEPTDPSLVDDLAELKMIRSLQLQVNRLTQQYGQTLAGEQATDPDDLSFLQKLSFRQQRIQKAAYDLSIGKNR